MTSLASQPASPRFSSLGQRVHPPTIAKLMAMALENPSLLSLAAGFTDNSTLPAAIVQQAVGELTAASDREFLQYGTNTGRPQLRRLLAQRLCAQEDLLDPAAVEQGFFITNGSQQALYLAMQVLCEPGDIVLVDRPSYFVFLEMLAGLGVTARSIPVNERGRVDGPALRSLLREWGTGQQLARLKAVYFVSYFSNPSGRSLTAEEKNVLAETLAAEGVVVPVIEDAAYRELYYDAPVRAKSILSAPAWAGFPRLYLSTLTKPFATGLKVGYGSCSDPTWLAKMLYVKGHQDFGTANFNQAVFERVLSNGGFDAQLSVLRPHYQRKMRTLHETLVQAGLPHLGWSWSVPEGGLYLWLRAPDRLDTGLESAFCRSCIEAGVLYVPGELCFGDAVPRNYVRLSFGVLSETELAEAGRRFATTARGFA
jgi:2-aminoadipate transaminase